MAGDGDRLALRAHSVAAEFSAEFGSRDGLGRVHFHGLNELRKTSQVKGR